MRQDRLAVQDLMPEKNKEDSKEGQVRKQKRKSYLRAEPIIYWHVHLLNKEGEWLE